MRPGKLKATAAGATKWFPVDYRQNAFNISLAAIVSSGANLTYKVENTYDDPYVTVPFYATRSTTTATATVVSHDATAGDTIMVYGAGTPLDGRYLVASVVDADTFTYTVVNSGVIVSSPGAKVNITRAFDHPTIVTKTGNFAGVDTSPVRAVRLNVTSFTSGEVVLTIIQGNPGGH
jgi:hypothetical protein